MALELSPAQQKVLHETREAESPAEFEALLKLAQPEMNRIVREVMEPSQALSTTILELRDLYLSVSAHEAELTKINYDAARRTTLRDSIRLVVTANLWLGEGARTGSFRTRSVEEVVQASRPWRARLKAFGAHAFTFQPDVAELFADVNTTGTLEEEQADLKALNDLVKQYGDKLAEVGMTAEHVSQGQALLDEASGRDLLAVLGLRNQGEALALRNRIVTYAMLLAGEGRAAGINGCFDDEAARRRFEAASFRSALRRLRPRRKRTAGDAAGDPAGDPTADAGAKGDGGADSPAEGGASAGVQPS